MKRDIDLVRDILIRAREPDQLSFDDELTAEHVIHLIDKSYLDGKYIRDEDGKLAFIDVFGLTGTGTALREAIWNDDVWTRTKKVLSASLDRIPLEAVRATAEVVEKHLGANGPG